MSPPHTHTPSHSPQALNDEEKAIDLELALELLLRAYVAQYNDDHKALCAMFRWGGRVPCVCEGEKGRMPSRRRKRTAIPCTALVLAHDTNHQSPTQLAGAVCAVFRRCLQADGGRWDAGPRMMGEGRHCLSTTLACHPPRRSAFEVVGRRLITPDDLAAFLRQLAADKASAMPPDRLLGMYVEAMRASGPHNADLGRVLCRTVLDSGG